MQPHHSPSATLVAVYLITPTLHYAPIIHALLSTHSDSPKGKLYHVSPPCSISCNATHVPQVQDTILTKDSLVDLHATTQFSHYLFPLWLLGQCSVQASSICPDSLTGFCLFKFLTWISTSQNAFISNTEGIFYPSMLRIIFEMR